MSQSLRLLPEEMRAAARDIERLSDDVDQLWGALQHSWRRLDHGWHSYARENVDGYYRQTLREIAFFVRILKQLSASLYATVEHICSVDEDCAESFAFDYKGGVGQYFSGNAIDTSKIRADSRFPRVLFASASIPSSGLPSHSLTIEELTEFYDGKSWQTKFDEETRIEQDIADLKRLIPEDFRDLTPEEIDERLETLEEKIADLEREKSDADERAGKFFNKVLPDLPFKRDREDGVPWRVKTDDYEDVVAECDRKLTDLRKRKQELVNHRPNLQSLRALHNQKKALSRVIDEGISPDGPMENTWLHSQLSGCTHYVSEKRDVSAWPNASGEPGHPKNAKHWHQQAVDAGYEVGARPVKGSIMVIDSDELPHKIIDGKDYAFWTDAGANPQQQLVSGGAGHVSYVEDVTQVEGDDGRILYEVEISEAGTVRDSDDNLVKGTHTSPVKRTFLFDPSTVEDGVDFIYEPSKEKTQNAGTQVA